MRTINCVSLTLLLACGAFGQKSRHSPSWKADLEYGFRDELGKPVPKSHWKLEELSDKSLLVQTQQEVGDGKQIQLLHFNAHLQPMGYKLIQTSKQSSLTLSCDFRRALVACAGEKDGHRSAARLSIRGPYVFLSTEFTTDPFWLAAALVSQASHVEGQQTQIQLVSMVEGDTDDKFGLEVQETDTVTYIGKKRYASVFGPVECDVFELGGDQYWVTSSGIVLAITGKDEPVELVALQENLRHTL